MRNIRLRHLRYLLVLADELHFGRAAKRLNISQPLLSRNVHELEEELGVNLFSRTKRQVRITDAGEKFIEEARDVLLKFNCAMRLAKSADSTKIENLIIGSITCETALLADSIRAFSKRVPHVHLEIQSLGVEEQILQAVKQGHIDIGLMMSPVHATGLVIEKVGSEPRLLALPVGHPLSARRSIPLHLLVNETFILLSRSFAPGAHDQVIRTCAEAGVSLNIRYEVTNVITGMALVEAGLGVSLFPAGFEAFSRQGIVFRAVTPPFPDVEYAVAYRKDANSAAVALFVSAMKRVFTQRSRSRARTVRLSRN